MRTVPPDLLRVAPREKAPRPAFAAWRLALYLIVAALLLNLIL